MKVYAETKIQMLGDSLSDTGKGSGAPPKFVQLLQVWLKQAFGKRFKNQGNILPHAIQDDGYSCAIVTANTIAHAVLERPLWHPAATITERLNWVMRIATSISDGPSSTSQLEIEFEEDNVLLKPQNRSALTITDLLNPIQPTSPIQLRDYDSDSDSHSVQSELIDNIGSDTYANDHATIADSEASNPRGNGSAMQVDDEGLKQLAPRKRPQYSGSRNFDNDSSDSETSDDARPSKYVKSGDGTSKSAVASRSLRNSVKSGTFNINQEKFQNWKTKILQSDRDAEFDEHDLWKIRHSVSVLVIVKYERRLEH